MRNFALAIACLAAVGFVLPAVPASAQDRVVVKTDRGHDRDRDWQRHHHKKVVVIKHRHRDHDDHDHR
jgi:hypothetical protein